MIHEIIKQLDGKNKKFIFTNDFKDIIKNAKDSKISIAYCYKDNKNDMHYMHITGHLESTVSLSEYETNFYIYEGVDVPKSNDGLDKVTVKLGNERFNYYVMTAIKDATWFRLLNDDETISHCGFIFKTSNLKKHL